MLAVEAEGHAGTAKRGEDLVCASVTVLLRTTLSVLASDGDASPGSAPRIDAETTGRGALAFRVTGHEAGHGQLLRYAARFLIEGVGSLERDAPGAVTMRVETINE